MRGINAVRLVSAAAIVLTASAALCQESVSKGIEEFRHGKYERAKATLDAALKEHPGDQHAVTFLALARAATGGCQQAESDLARIFAESKNADLRRLAGLGIAQCHLAANRADDAVPVVMALRKQFPDDADVLYEAAKLHMKAWNDVVFELFQKAPASYRVNQISAEIFEIQGRYAEAAAEYRKAIAKNPAAVNLHFRLGRALLLESHAPGALAEARTEFESELKLNPEDAAAEYEVGQVLVAEGNPQEAAGRFERALALSPNFTEALVAVAKLHSEAKRYNEAIPLLERAARFEPGNESVHYSLMLAYRNAGRTADAQREKDVIDRLQRPPGGEFTEFLKKLGEKAPNQ